MIDPNSPDPSKRKSFFDEDSMDDGVDDRRPYSDQRANSDRERMASRYHDDEDDYADQEYDRKKSSKLGFLHSLGGGSDGGNSTRRLTYAAGGVGALLVVFIGGWMFLNSSNKGVPVFEPPAEVAKVKPANTGNVETIGMGGGDNALNNNAANPNGQPSLLPGPEKANPQALADQYNRPPPPVAPKPVITAPPPAPAANEGEETPQPPKHAVHPKHQQPHHAIEKKKEVNKKAEVKKPATHTEAQHASSGSFGLQLASLKSLAAAQKQWQILKKKAPEVLGKYSPAIQKAEVSGNAVYRLRIKGLASKAQVNTVCSQLKAKGIPCTIAY